MTSYHEPSNVTNTSSTPLKVPTRIFAQSRFWLRCGHVRRRNWEGLLVSTLDAMLCFYVGTSRISTVFFYLGIDFFDLR